MGRRRLADRQGLIGIILRSFSRSQSLDDLVVHSEVGKLRGACDLSSEEVTQSLKKVYGLKYQVVRTKAAVN